MAMNGRLNCLLEVCCGAAAAETALAEQLAEDLGWPIEQARDAARQVRSYVDFAPKGSLGLLKAEVARLARQPQTPAGKP